MKDSFLKRHVNLIRHDAPKVMYRQSGDQDLCIPKAFASVLLNAGFKSQAQKVNTEFSNTNFKIGINRKFQNMS